MKKKDLLQAQLKYAQEYPGINADLLETVMQWVVEVDRIHDHLRILVESLSGHPKGRFDMLRALFLHPQGNLRPAELATVAEMTRASSSHNLDVLEREKLIHRAIDPNDRRSAKVSLTPKGRDFMVNLMPKYLKAIESFSTNTASSLTQTSVMRLQEYNTKIELLIEKLKDHQRD